MQMMIALNIACFDIMIAHSHAHVHRMGSRYVEPFLANGSRGMGVLPPQAGQCRGVFTGVQSAQLRCLGSDCRRGHDLMLEVVGTGSGWQL